jgi:hypothetical protein
VGRNHGTEVRMELAEVLANFLHDRFLMLGGDDCSALASDD